MLTCLEEAGIERRPNKACFCNTMFSSRTKSGKKNKTSWAAEKYHTFLSFSLKPSVHCHFNCSGFLCLNNNNAWTTSATPPQYLLLNKVLFQVNPRCRVHTNKKGTHIQIFSRTRVIQIGTDISIYDSRAPHQRQCLVKESKTVTTLKCVRFFFSTNTCLDALRKHYFRMSADIKFELEPRWKHIAIIKVFQMVLMKLHPPSFSELSQQARLRRRWWPGLILTHTT